MSHLANPDETVRVVVTEQVDVSGLGRIVCAVGGTVVRCALIGAVVFGLSGCGGGQPAAQLPPTVGDPGASTSSAGAGAGTGTGSGQTTGTPGSTGTTAGPGAPGGGVDVSDPLAVYQGWWSAIEKALATANPNEPGLAQYGADPLLGATFFRLARLNTANLVQVVHYTHDQQVLGRSATRMDIADCVRGPAFTFRDARTGQPRAPSGFRNDIPTSDSIRSVLQLIAGRWYVTAIQAGSKQC